MEFVYVGIALGCVAIVLLSMVAFRLYKAVRIFGKEVNRVSAKLQEAAAGLEKAAGNPPSPRSNGRINPEP